MLCKASVGESVAAASVLPKSGGTRAPLPLAGVRALRRVAGLSAARGIQFSAWRGAAR